MELQPECPSTRALPLVGHSSQCPPPGLQMKLITGQVSGAAGGGPGALLAQVRTQQGNAPTGNGSQA